MRPIYKTLLTVLLIWVLLFFATSNPARRKMSNYISPKTEQVLEAVNTVLIIPAIPVIVVVLIAKNMIYAVRYKINRNRDIASGRISPLYLAIDQEDFGKAHKLLEDKDLDVNIGLAAGSWYKRGSGFFISFKKSPEGFSPFQKAASRFNRAHRRDSISKKSKSYKKLIDLIRAHRSYKNK